MNSPPTPGTPNGLRRARKPFSPRSLATSSPTYTRSPFQSSPTSTDTRTLKPSPPHPSLLSRTDMEDMGFMTPGYDTLDTPDTEDEEDDFGDDGFYGGDSPSRRLRSARRTTPRPSPLRKRQPRGGMSGTEGVARTPVKRPRGRPRKVSQPVTATVGSQVLEAGGSFVTEVGGKMFWILKKPLAWVAALYCLAVVGSFAVQYLQNSVYGMMAPLCNIPGVGMLELPFCETGPDGGYSGSGGWGGRRARDRKASAEFPKFIELQTSFEGVLESSAGGSVMAQDLKNSEVAVRDLNTLVKHSKLASKDILSKRLDGFVAGAKEASYSLLKFSSGVRGVVDMLIALDEYAIASLENIKAAQIAGGHQPGAPSTVGSLLLAPFRSAPVDTARAEHELLVNFVKASSVMDESIKGLILQAVSTLSGLQELDDKLLVIDEIVQRESVDVQKERLELWEIWTKLGGNRHTIANLENHESLLSNLGSYRKRALAHISASLIQLQTMQADLEDLRERVATPGLIGGDGSGEWGGELPLEVHIQSIRKGVDRLSEGMKRAKTREQKHMAGLLKQHDDAIRKLGSAPPPEVNA